MSEEIKQKCMAIIAKHEANIKKEKNLQRELADDKMSMSKAGELLILAEPIPENFGFEDWGKAMEKIEKEVAASTSALAKIEENKIEIEALQYYIDNI